MVHDTEVADRLQAEQLHLADLLLMLQDGILTGALGLDWVCSCGCPSQAHVQRRPSTQGKDKRRERMPVGIHVGWEMHTHRDDWLGGKKKTTGNCPYINNLSCPYSAKLTPSWPTWFFTGSMLLINDFISFTILVSLLNSFFKEDKNWGPSSGFSPPGSTCLGLKARLSPFWSSRHWFAALLWPHPHLWVLGPPCGFSRDDSLVCKT